MKRLWQKFLDWCSWRRAGRGLTLAIVASVAIATIWLALVTWRKFPPTDAAGAWTFIAAIGGLSTALATFALAAFALRGLRSIAVARDEILHRTKREAQLCAIERMEEIATILVPLNTKALDAMVQHGISPFLGEKDKVQLDPDPVDISQAKAWWKAVPPEPYGHIIAVLNRLEAWSVYFSTGVADETIVFGPIAPLLRSWVGQYYAVLLYLRAGGPRGTSGAFPNLVRLYNVWSARMDADQLARQHADVQAQIEHAKQRMVKQQLPPSTPNITA